MVSHLIRCIAKTLYFQESRSILNACTKKVWKLIEGTTYIYIYIIRGETPRAQCQRLLKYNKFWIKDTCTEPKDYFYVKTKRKKLTSNLFLVVMTIIRCCTKKKIICAFLYCFRREWDLKKKLLIRRKYNIY